ncbi:unnamed protein product [marine sediment metagenome]|uniref:Uncharacterized protein n=1 Tax=marine sediment metagenome TaxID=412755 RepID=X0UN74_9ZZZZ
MKNDIGYLKERLEFRQKLLLEWLFVDNRLIEDFDKFRKDTKEIEDKIIQIQNQKDKVKFG